MHVLAFNSYLFMLKSIKNFIKMAFVINNVVQCYLNLAFVFIYFIHVIFKMFHQSFMYIVFQINHVIIIIIYMIPNLGHKQLSISLTMNTASDETIKVSN